MYYGLRLHESLLYPLFPRHAADVVARGVRRCKRLLQRIRLFGRWLQFDLGDGFHILNGSTSVFVVQTDG